MTKVTPSPRKSAAAAVGLAAIGVIAGPVPAHAADTTSFPISTNLSAVSGLLSHGGKNASPLQGIPVLGTLVQRVGLGPESSRSAEGGGPGRPLARSAMPVMPVMPAVEPTSSSALSLTSLAD